MVELSAQYTITSNRESDLGRYDVMLKPKHSTSVISANTTLKNSTSSNNVISSDTASSKATIMEFKVYDAEDEKTLQDTVNAALLKIEEKHCAASLAAEGISLECIRKYGFAFQGKNVLIG